MAEWERRKERIQVGEDAFVIEFWGSDCLDCGNTTSDSNHCDECGSDKHTVQLVTIESAS